jgi:hypothetical protein
MGLCDLGQLTNTPKHRAAVIGLYVSYVSPIFLRITSGRDKFVPGYFTLGRWATPIGAIAVAWVSFIVVLLMFPPDQTTSPSTMSTRMPPISRFYLIALPDYAVVLIMAVFLFASGSWIFSAHKWFTGPVRNLEDAGSAAGLDEKQG